MSGARRKRKTKKSSKGKTLQNSYKSNVKKLINNYENKNSEEQSGEEYMQVALIEAEKLWLELRTVLANNSEAYFKLKDEEKLNMFKSDFGEFQKEFPIVSRYIICMGQYKRKAFEKYLKKCKNTIPNMQERMKDKNYMQNQWIERQADYVRYLWEEYQDGRVNRKESNKIWRQTYESLKKEFKDFRELYKKTEEKVKRDDMIYKKQLLSEVLDMTSNSNQKLSDQNLKELLDKLKTQQVRQRRDILLKQIKEDIPHKSAIISGYGKNRRAGYEYEAEMKQLKHRKKINYLKNSNN